MSNYPLGAKDDPRAPWNEKPIKMDEIEIGRASCRERV